MKIANIAGKKTVHNSLKRVIHSVYNSFNAMKSQRCISLFKLKKKNVIYMLKFQIPIS